MRIIKVKTIKDYYESNVSSEDALLEWYHTINGQFFKDHNALKERFPSVDYVGQDRYVFNIKGNNFRIICIILFQFQKVYVRFIGTHAEYDKIKDISNI